MSNSTASTFKSQHGYTMLVYIITLFLLTIAALGLVGKDIVFDSQSKAGQSDMQALEQAKERLKLFALLTPYLYISTIDTGAGYKDIEQVPGIGYFPCPDYDGDGDSESVCGNPSPATYQNRSVTLSAGATSPVANVGYLPYFVKSRLFQISSDHQKRPLYLVDTKFAVNNECFTNFFPTNIFMDARDYSDASNGILSASITPSPTCPGISTLVDSSGRGIALNLAYINNAAANTTDPNHSLANELLTGKTLSMDTLMACDPTVCTDSSGNRNPYIAPAQSFFDPGLMPRIKINNRPFYVFALISPGNNGQFESTVTTGSYSLAGTTVDDGTVNIIQGGDDIVLGFHFLEWAKLTQEKLCSDRAYYSEIVQSYLTATSPALLNKHWLFRHDQDNTTDGYTNQSGTNWSDQLFAGVFSSPNLPGFSICELKIIEE